jgi:hypothetical protein
MGVHGVRVGVGCGGVALTVVRPQQGLADAFAPAPAGASGCITAPLVALLRALEPELARVEQTVAGFATLRRSS